MKGRPPARRAKKGTATRGTVGWDRAMIAARSQAEAYARALPATEPRPPFLLVVDIEHAIDLYAEFTRTGGVYVAFPDARANRVRMDDLADEEVRDQLRRVWADPLSLDPSRRSARVTTDLARKLAALARSLTYVPTSRSGPPCWSTAYSFGASIACWSRLNRWRSDRR